jgi:hypothetical protein
METILILALLLMLVAAVAPAVYALRTRMAMGSGELEFWRVLRRRGLSAAEAAEEPRNIAVALRRCALCPSVGACHEWLEAGAHGALEDFCPNAAYMRKLERS